jgi:amino acid permease
MPSSSSSDSSSDFNYHNKEVKHMKGGSKIIRKVTIKDGKGHKSVTKYHKNKKISSVKKPINKSHLMMIKIGKFIPGLFSDCKCGEKKTRKNRK